jgi:hypothetical protein
LRAGTRRQFTTFYTQKVVENHYGWLKKVVRKQFLGQRSRQRRRGEPRGDQRTAWAKDTRRGKATTAGYVGYYFKDGRGQDKKTGRTEEEPMHGDFVQIRDVNNQQENLEGRKRRRKYSSCDSGKEEESSFDREKRTNFRTFCKHKVVENNYGCLQNVVRTSEREEREERRQLLGREVDQGHRQRRTSDTLHER